MTTTMQFTPAERESIATICLMAAFADGLKSDAERAQVNSIVTSFADAGGGNLPQILERVQSGKASLDDAAAGLTNTEVRTRAYEMAVVVCDADDVCNDAERAFLNNLRSKLNLGNATGSFEKDADGLAAAALPTTLAAPTGANREAELDSTILKYSIANAALELLPQTISSAAIIPLQMKMVYTIGKAYGYPLDRKHITDFLATVGIGATSQILENFTRRILGEASKKYGGLLGNMLGKITGGAVEHGTGPAFSFVTTYALGQVAKQYYAQGRTMNIDMLRATFMKQTEGARALFEKVRPQIEQQAKLLSPANLKQLISNIGA